MQCIFKKNKKNKNVVDYFLFGVFFVGNILNKIYFIKQKQFPSLKEKKTTTTHLTQTKWFESYHNVVQISCTKEEINGVYISETNNLLRSSISPPTLKKKKSTSNIQ